METEDGQKKEGNQPLMDIVLGRKILKNSLEYYRMLKKCFKELKIQKYNGFIED